MSDSIIFWGSFADKPYLAHLKGCVGSATTFLRIAKTETLSEVAMYCKTKGVYKVVSTDVELLKKLLDWKERKAPQLSSYQGSYFKYENKLCPEPIEIVFISPLKQLFTVTYGKFLATRYITKLINPDSWYTPTEFKWELANASTVEDIYERYKSAAMMAVDIETFKENAVIRCISYTAVFYTDEGGFRTETCVLPLDSAFMLSWIGKFNNLPMPKIFQNGKYDNAYLTRYNVPVYNWACDTAHFFHSWYSELPKDLGFLNSFFIREAFYWKDLAETNDLMEYYRYNALDTWGTANTWIAMMLEAPQFAWNNYYLEFPLVFPCHLAEMTGIEREPIALKEAAKEQQAIVDEKSNQLDTILGVKNFNANSPKQMKALLKILGCGDLKSADEKNLAKARFRHPLNGRIVGLVIEIRKARKLLSTYLKEGKEFHRLDGSGNRILYALNPQGTDSSRLASREHAFWCGLQIQNQPRGPIVKQTYSADPGFGFAEADLEQAESRDTAYISGSEALIKAVEFSPDFHSQNASAFFGVPFERIYDTELGKTIDKALRDLAKRVNHGANYNMGPFILVETMGEENIYKAQRLLNLPSYWDAKKIAEYLLDQFHATYPELREVFHKGVVSEILTTSRLTSTAIHYSTDIDNYEALLKETPRWTRYCFGNPTKSKPILNSYVSHPPQSLNAQTLNKAWLRVFNEIAMNPKYSAHFKLCAQIHDSILFQYRLGHEYLCDMVKEYMEIPITIKAYDDKVRTFTVPAEVKAGTTDKPALYWSETE